MYRVYEVFEEIPEISQGILFGRINGYKSLTTACKVARRVSTQVAKIRMILANGQEMDVDTVRGGRVQIGT